MTPTAQKGTGGNNIKVWKFHHAADRTSCTKATASRFRLFLHAGPYWLLWSLRLLMAKRSRRRTVQFDTVRLRLVKIAARIVEMKTEIRVHLPTGTPDQAIIHPALGRLLRLICGAPGQRAPTVSQSRPPPTPPPRPPATS